MNAIAKPGYHFRPLSMTMPDAWRALDRAVARWVLIHGGSSLLAQIAGWTSLAEGFGDSALPLTGSDADRHGMPALDETQLAALRAEALVGGENQRGDTPFVLDDTHFYLRRNYAHEVVAAQRIRQRRATLLESGQASQGDLDVLFNGAAGSEVQAQRDAVSRVLGRRLFVLTGGPGTGKTTTILRMLLMLAKDRAERGIAAPAIRIAAPTGKAAQRLSESLRDGARRLLEHPAHALPAAWQPHLATALSAEAGTLHRLLGSRGRRGGFRHHADNPLPANIVVVDEASMVDLDLLHALLDALRDDTALIVVGDADQLTSVGTGSVLLDMVAALESAAAPDLVRLHHSFRADTSLVPINEAILRGDMAAFETALRNAGARAVRRDVATLPDLRRALRTWCRELRKLLQDCGARDSVPSRRQDLVLKAIDGLRGRQLLCALRESEFGSEQINAAIERALRSEFDDDGDGVWYPGRAVMITRNDYSAGLFNGDVGLCLRDEDGHLGVWFEAAVQHDPNAAGDPLASGEASRRALRFAPGSLPEHQGAFAVTIHKSQGSEYAHVAVLLPPDAENRILSRQLLYTGVSRARQAMEIWSTQTAIETAIATPARRTGGLGKRLEASDIGA